MLFYFVRHGHPNYKNDCLTELGVMHAEAAAKRLSDCNIERIFSSTCGRAYETAERTASVLGLPIERCDFMREIPWTSIDGEEIPFNGNPWEMAYLLVSEGKPLTTRDWQTVYPFSKSKVVTSTEKVANGIDEVLETLGYKREGDYYRVVGEDTDKTVAMFSHGGSSTAALSHILNIPFPQMCSIVQPNYTAITIVSFSDKHGVLTQPKLLLANDARHIEGLETKIIYE